MNKLSVEKLLTLIQVALVPVAIFIILLSLAFSAKAANDDKPSMELLEFLGEWQTKDGEWVDPLRFLDINEDDLRQEDSVSKVNVKEDIRDD